jgi:hypothetical protein
MNAYDDFCEFAWTQLEDAFHITQEDGIPFPTPYYHFIIGCAAESLQGSSDSFAFTLDQVLGNYEEGFAERFIQENLHKNRAKRNSN